jgi:hypothetical protein
MAKSVDLMPGHDNDLVMPARRYRYVGPAELLPTRSLGGAPIVSRAGLDQWIANQGKRDQGEPFTFVIDRDEVLRLAPRRTEHVDCAGGGEVLAAGEIQFTQHEGQWLAEEISNQSTGYCPDIECWSAVSATLDRLDVYHPGHFTRPIVFRLCPRCHERNVVRDGVFVCAMGSDDVSHG